MCLGPPAPPPPPGPYPPATTCPRHDTETHRTYQWEIGCLVHGVGEGASLAHAPRYPYRLGINGTVWGFGLKQVIAGLPFSRESRWRRPRRGRITPPHLLSWPCVSDLLRSKRPRAATRCNPRWLDNPNSGHMRNTSVAVCNLYCVRVIIVRLNKRSKPRSFEHN